MLNFGTYYLIRSTEKIVIQGFDFKIFQLKTFMLKINLGVLVAGMFSFGPLENDSCPVNSR